uniref:Nicastrin n=1 Tax=Onchocerca volvulus TaxID=6282 RepID=A0A8R1TW88_ONCVO
MQLTVGFCAYINSSHYACSLSLPSFTVTLLQGSAVDADGVDMKHWYRFLLFVASCMLECNCKENHSVKIICGERLSDQIYLDLSGGRYSCFRLLNGSHEIGCAAEEGNEGVIVYADSADQLINLITSLDFSDRIITAFDIFLLNERIIRVLKDDRVRGVLLLFNDSAVTDGFSEDAFCPNKQFDLNGECENRWNERGALLPEGFRFINWKKPIFVIENRTEIDIIRSFCYEAFNKRNLRGPVLCSARMKHFMRAAGNAEICLRRQRLFYGFSDSSISLCDPLGDKNLFATVPAFIKEFRPKILMLSARMDSFSSFTEAAVGEVSVLTSLISLLAVAKTISNHSSEFEAVARHNRRAVIFAFFHGESLGYIGSSATVNDIIKGEFPLDIRLKDIDSFIEVQQLDGSESVFSAHIDSKSYDNPENKRKVQILLDAARSSLKQSESRNDGNRRDSKINVERKIQLPPSSYQSFLKEKRDIAGFVLRPFGRQYIYNRINSLEDQNVFKNGTAKLKNQIIAAANAVMGAVTGFLTGGNKTETDLFSQYDIDELYVAVLLDCFLKYPDWHSCNFFKSISKGENQFEHYSKETYVSVGRNNYSLIRILMTMLIVNVLGSKNAVNVPDRGQCEDLNKHHKIYHYTWQYDPEDEKFTCYRNSLYTTTAESPAFRLDGYNMHSGVYSTWVESVWTTKQLKLFLTIHPYLTRDVTKDFFLGGCRHAHREYI